MTHSILLIAVMAGVTFLLRALPFWVFGENRKTPRIITYLSTMLPYAIMGMLVVYCLKDVTLNAYPYGIPEVICCMLVALLHAWRRNTLLSIGVGTVAYMLLIQLVF